LEFRIGEGAVIEGWDKGIAAMKIGEKAELIIKPEYAYGYATLIFTVELLSIEAAAKHKNEEKTKTVQALYFWINSQTHE